MSEKEQVAAALDCPHCKKTTSHVLLSNGRNADSLALCPDCGGQVGTFAALKAAALEKARAEIRKRIADTTLSMALKK